MAKYKLLIHKGTFKVFNIGRDKVVYTGKDAGFDNTVNTINFDGLTELLREISARASLATYKKVCKVLRP